MTQFIDFSLSVFIVLHITSGLAPSRYLHFLLPTQQKQNATGWKSFVPTQQKNNQFAKFPQFVKKCEVSRRTEYVVRLQK